VARQDPPELIVIGLGTNGPVQARHFDEVMELAADVPLVAFVNVRVPRSWEGISNREIAEGVERYDNAILVDWYEVTWNRNNLFAKDGVHPKQAGRVIMAELIADAVFPNWVPLEDS
jgi:lysophospholipase L1-like esterase